MPLERSAPSQESHFVSRPQGLPALEASFDSRSRGAVGWVLGWGCESPCPLGLGDISHRRADSSKFRATGSPASPGSPHSSLPHPAGFQSSRSVPSRSQQTPLRGWEFRVRCGSAHHRMRVHRILSASALQLERTGPPLGQGTHRLLARSCGCESLSSSFSRTALSSSLRSSQPMSSSLVFHKVQSNPAAGFL